jgi:hypothetical protein
MAKHEKQPVNPFVVQTPEDITADEALRLFVDVFADFNKVRDRGHCMVNGPRGCGKSMMFRYLLADCQRLALDCSLDRLPFFAILVSIKNTSLDLTELRRLANQHATVVLNEHLLAMYVASKVFRTLEETRLPSGKSAVRATHQYVQEVQRLLRISGWNGAVRSAASVAPQKAFGQLRQLCDSLYQETVGYVRRLTFSAAHPPMYSGPLCGYLDFIVPALESLRQLPYMPDGPIYLLMDDADYLSAVQTRVLNSWVATRTANRISIKISTQLKYKTYQTTSGARIEAPHDYTEINIADLYTTSQSKYLKRVTQIVQKRLVAAGIRRTPAEFFPPDEEQEEAIREIGVRLRRDWKVQGRGHRPSDDVLRYARPTFIASLGGSRKAGSTYSYAGFSQLVHISSGLVRFFLEPASQMFSEQTAVRPGVPDSISPPIQDRVIRQVAEELMLTGYEKMFKDDESECDEIERIRLLDRKTKLYNLIESLGGVFRAKLVSEDAERRVFSIALSGELDREVREILDLGSVLGFFHKSTIGNKEGTGRTPLYVLTRRLAPYFGLDPTGFAGYLFVTNDALLEAMSSPNRFLRRVKDKGVSEVFEERQLQLFS